MELEEACRQLEVDEVENHKLLAQRDLLPLMMASPFFNRVYSKPLGYAGDYEMVNMMFRKERGGKTTYAQIVNDWLLNGGPPQAHRNRIYLLEKMLAKAAEDATFSNKNLRVLNVGCGPVQELQLFIAKNKSAHRFSFDLLDFNAETLDYAKRQIECDYSRPRRSAEGYATSSKPCRSFYGRPLRCLPISRATTSSIAPACSTICRIASAPN